MKHPSQETLALQAGGDLGWLERWKTQRHLAACDDCRDEVAAFREMREVLPELNQMPEVPWNRVAAEMRANIHLGLSAGECVRVGDVVLRDSSLFNGARVMAAFASVCVLLVVCLALERPGPVGANKAVGQGTAVQGTVVQATVVQATVVQATDNAIQTRSGDRAFGLTHAGAQNVTYTVGAQGTLGARYVDPETGAMTMTKVYVE